MKKISKFLIIFIFVFCFISKIYAKEKVTINVFHLETCPHCKEELKWLNSLDDNYNIKYYEVNSNRNLYSKVVSKLDIASTGVPLTIIGSDYLVGYSSSIKKEIESIISKYENSSYCDSVLFIKNNRSIESCIKINSSLKNKTSIKSVPFLGDVDVKKVSLPLISIVIGAVDGFNPCAMWVLVFLITMLMNMKNKKRMWILGITFLVFSAFVYLVFMLAWLNIAVALFKTWFQYIIASVALIAGMFNLYNYYKSKKNESGCTVTTSKKRKIIMDKIKHIVGEKSFILAFIGIILLAISVNMLELACSAGLPIVFTQILSINNLSGIEYSIYMLLYILFFMLDDIVVFSIAMITFKVTGISNKYTKYSHLIGGIIMIIIGILMIFKMDLLMFNF